MEDRLAVLRVVGEALHGADWQRPITRGLGPLHPDGAREAIDDRLMRRWVSGERSVPAWVIPAAVSLLDREADRLLEESARLRSLSVSFTRAAFDADAEDWGR